MNLKKTLKYFDITRLYKYIKLKIHRHPATPENLALSIGLGAFIGVLPTFGFAIGLSILAAFFLKLPKIPCFLGTWVANPWTTPIFYTLSWKIGNFFFKLPIHDIAKEFQRKNIAGIFNDFHKLSLFIKNLIILYKPLLLGGIILAIPISIFLYYFSLISLKKLQKRKNDKLQKFLPF
ncbi:MAG: DUF2062 domain-containing protein [Candidatus Muirbacterium halophilum]|nr:DUF2062 domain-containing protein [Candidatus Muirbacterium halophilum]MCK9475079.1 DUF2062 domain-containing protein [Candidatus Muirbacterium halophilum]